MLHNIMDACWWHNESTETHVCKLSMDLEKVKLQNNIGSWLVCICWVMDAIGKTLKALANRFNILLILLNDNVESVCRPLSTTLNRCWKSWKAFKLCFNIRSTFLLFSGMFRMLKRSWSHLLCFFNIVEETYAQWRGCNHGHHGCKDGNKARQFCVWL